MRPILYLPAALCWAVCSFGSCALPQFAKAQTAAALDLPAKVDAIFQKWNHTDTPGCALGLRHGAAPPLVRAYGSADLEHGAGISQDTVFEAGSVSKQFTAAAILMLVERGKLGLDDDVRKYIPELPEYGAKMTIAQLLGHTSGLRDWEGIAEIAGWPRTTRLYTQKDVLEIATRQKRLNFKPGTEFSYTNTGYELLAVIVERVGGESLATFSSNYLFKPLGLLHTRWREDFRTVVRERAVAYNPDPHGYHQFMPFDDVIGSGGLLTTIGDLLSWNDALDAGKLGRFVSMELQRNSTLADGRTLPYARGLIVSSNHGLREVWHDGETAGYEAFLARYPDEHVSIALLCNAGEEVDPASLGGKVAAVLLPVLGKVSQAGAADEAPLAPRLEPYAGTYFSLRTGVRMRLEAKNGRLQRAPSDDMFSAIGGGIFKGPDSTMRFTGYDRFVREFTDGRRAQFERVLTSLPERQQLATLEGRYTSEEALASLNVRVVSGHLVIVRDDRQWSVAHLDMLSTDTFSTGHSVYRFERDTKGKIVSLHVSDSAVYDLPFRRLVTDAATQP
jgi:CubicO group peptidase (beta-lactamase class C family)